MFKKNKELRICIWIIIFPKQVIPAIVTQTLSREKRAVPLPKPCVLWQTLMCQRLRPVPPQLPPSFPPPEVRISPKCWRSVTCMFNSFQKHRKAIWRREASGSADHALRSRARSALPGTRAAPAGPSEPRPPSRCSLAAAADTKSAPLPPFPIQVYSELKFLSPL